MANCWKCFVFVLIAMGTAMLSLGCSEKSKVVPVGSPPGTSVTYSNEIQPLFDNRCIACHGCIGSACNVKLSSFRGVERGGFGENPYAMRFDAAPRTGMDVHATTEEWRNVGFYPIVSRGKNAAENRAGSMISQLVTAGHKSNQPGFSRQALMASYKDRYKHSCPSTAEALKVHLAANPAEGMPYGLPALSDAQLDHIDQWVLAGSPGPTEAELAKASTLANPEAVARWESFFNQADAQHQLVSRYIFDHVYLSTLALDESPGELFKLVRSKTAGNSVAEAAAGKATPKVEVIDTPKPYDNPMVYAGVEQFYYRLQKVTFKPVQKNHFVWQLGQDDVAHLESVFFDRKWTQDENFSAPWDVGNPFAMYQAIPAKSRYLFLIENSAIIVGGITSGPVCLGQTATYAVKDQFWVYFMDPDHDVSVLDPQLGLGSWDALMDRSPVGNERYDVAYGNAVKSLFPQGYTIDALWDGNKTNKNAWLTILRHESNTWVMTGRQGGIPRSQWVMGFSGFERIYYDTVAHFEYWGGDAGKLETVGFFNFLRQEFEDDFLLFLPADVRVKIRQEWSKGIGDVGLHLTSFAAKDQPSPIKNNDPGHPLVGVVSNIEAHMGPIVSGPVDHLNPWVKQPYPLEKGIANFDEWTQAIAMMTVTTDYQFPRYLPSLTVMRVKKGTESRLYSLVANRVYETQYTILFQNGEALPDLDTMSVYPDVVGGFPNLFMEIDIEQGPAFIQELQNIGSLADFLEFRDRYAVLRNQDNFWATYDWFNDWNFTNRKQDAGVLDLSYYDLFDSVY
ncbi:MAG: fatty acid cis/trans isomerase [Gammaproteobacteria bacterium]|nr:fatty acid cis/trans isomerase [Gammaproteobacteria bacterium]